MNRSVAVIGGSAAGFFTAYLLASRGRRVHVFEASDPLDPSPRTLIVTSRLRDLLAGAGEAAVVNEIRRFELFTDGRSATVPLRRPDLVVERSTLIRSLAARAEAAGAQVLSGRRFLSLGPDGSGLTFTVQRVEGGTTEDREAGTIVGADGAFSRVAREAGWPGQPTASLVQAVVRLPEDLPPDTARVWFRPEETPYFYWLIPESPTRGVLGLISEECQGIREHLERFLETKRVLPLEFQGARIPLPTRWVSVHRRIGEGDVYLVGDAAGQVKVTTVGGVIAGFRGAVCVAEAILNGGSGRRLRALRRELAIHLLIRKVLHGFTQADYSRLLDLLQGSTRSQLSLYTRDEAWKILRHLFVREPRLLLLGIRALLVRGEFPARSCG